MPETAVEISALKENYTVRRGKQVRAVILTGFSLVFKMCSEMFGAESRSQYRRTGVKHLSNEGQALTLQHGSIIRNSRHHRLRRLKGFAGHVLRVR